MMTTSGNNGAVRSVGGEVGCVVLGELSDASMRDRQHNNLLSTTHPGQKRATKTYLFFQVKKKC